MPPNIEPNAGAAVAAGAGENEMRFDDAAEVVVAGTSGRFSVVATGVPKVNVVGASAATPDALETVVDVGDVKPVELTAPVPVVVVFAGDVAPKEKVNGFATSLGFVTITDGSVRLANFSESLTFFAPAASSEEVFPKPASLIGLLMSAEMPLLVTVAAGVGAVVEVVVVTILADLSTIASAACFA